MLRLSGRDMEQFRNIVAKQIGQDCAALVAMVGFLAVAFVVLAS